MVHLHRHEGINQSGLAEILEIKGVTLGRLVDRLEAAGWVERRSDASDRRARRLYTTAKVAPVLESMLKIRANLSERGGAIAPFFAPPVPRRRVRHG